jgi:hypothetical protein
MPTQQALQAVGMATLQLPHACPIRWLGHYSDGDRVVTPASARLDGPRYGAANPLIPGCGHLTICRDVRLIRTLVRELIRTETLPMPMPRRRVGASREPMAP